MPKPRKKTLPPIYHSYHGCVHIPSITTTKHISLGKNITLNQGCPNHVVVNTPDTTDTRAD